MAQQSNPPADGSLSETLDVPTYFPQHFPTDQLPRLSFNEQPLPVCAPPQCLLVESTLGLGCAALTCIEEEKALELFSMLQQLHRECGFMGQLEVRLDSDAQRDLLLALSQHGHQAAPSIPVSAVLMSPHQTTHLLRDLSGLEVGLPFAASYYWYAPRTAATPRQAVHELRHACDTCLTAGLVPRVDLIDVTRADLEGLVLPVLEHLVLSLRHHDTFCLRIRLCDTLGLGLPWSEAPLPRSIPRLLTLLQHTLGLQHRQLQFVGYNDMGLALINSLAAVAYGCGSVVSTISGIGERTGIAPLEQILVHLGGLYGSRTSLRTMGQAMAWLTAQGFPLPDRHPFWGERALTIPADQASPSTPEDRWAPFNTTVLLCRPPTWSSNAR